MVKLCFRRFKHLMIKYEEIIIFLFRTVNSTNSLFGLFLSDLFLYSSPLKVGLPNTTDFFRVSHLLFF